MSAFSRALKISVSLVHPTDTHSSTHHCALLSTPSPSRKVVSYQKSSISCFCPSRSCSKLERIQIKGCTLSANYICTLSMFTHRQRKPTKIMVTKDPKQNAPPKSGNNQVVLLKWVPFGKHVANIFSHITSQKNFFSLCCHSCLCTDQRATCNIAQIFFRTLFREFKFKCLIP